MSQCLLIHKLIMEWNVYNNIKHTPHFTCNICTLVYSMLIFCVCVFRLFCSIEEIKNPILCQVWEFYCDHVKTLPGRVVEEYFVNFQNLHHSEVIPYKRWWFQRIVCACVFFLNLQFVLLYWCGTNIKLPVLKWLN